MADVHAAGVGGRADLRSIGRMAEHPLHVVAVTGFVEDEEGRVLLVRVRDRGWEMPGGQVEKGEWLTAALEREVEEESGCRVQATRLIGVYSKLSAPVMVLHLFSCRYAGGEARAREDAVPEVAWFDREEARRLVTQPSSAQRLADALSFSGEVVYRVYRLLPYESLLERTV
jgi:8-oxo-dGTP diphosphatase